LAEALLAKLNYSNRTQIKPLKLTRLDDGGYHLDMTGSNYRSLIISIQGVYQRNVLEPLKLTSLDISGSKITSLKSLQGINLTELKMADVRITSKKYLVQQAQALKLKRIILNESAYSPDVIAQLKETMTVVNADQ
ncbi:hypothetical protein, partial [Pontiella sp.]|uniref:hypothetical protein n=1 Tax=Pontiella sp. TaxID=2837462 RepID=UPI003563818E